MKNGDVREFVDHIYYIEKAHLFLLFVAKTSAPAKCRKSKKPPSAIG